MSSRMLMCITLAFNPAKEMLRKIETHSFLVAIYK